MGRITQGMSKLSFKSYGFTLAATLFKADNPKSLAFLLIQGWQGHQNLQAAQALADLGFTCMSYDMRGNEESEGNLADFSRADFINDAVTAYDFFKEQLSEGTKIGVVGSSFGSYTAILLSKERPVYCLSLRVPASYPDEGFTDPQMPQAGTDELMAWRQQPLDYSENMAFRALHDFTGKVQIVEADRDELVPHQAVANYASAMADKTKLRHDILQDSPHNLADDRLRNEYVALVTAWAKALV